MAWKLDASVGQQLRMTFLTAEAMGSVDVLRTALTRNALRDLLAQTLLLESDHLATDEAITNRLEKTLGEACRVPPILAGVSSMRVYRSSLELARHLGIDPVRLMLTGCFGKPKVRKNDQSIEASIKYTFGERRQNNEPHLLDIDIALSSGATWRGNRMLIRNTVLPSCVISALPGKPITEIISHPWSGWRKMTITNAAQRGKTLMVGTGEHAETRGLS